MSGSEQRAVFPAQKIIHIDMDAFFASVEQRDRPELRGKPVAVGHEGSRGVVATASYEARKYGVHSAMSSLKARELCPHLVFLPPDFERYRAVSRQVFALFRDYTDLVEALSIDEAFLDVTCDKQGIGDPVEIARRIRRRIREELHLTASAGVAQNLFLAKVAHPKLAKVVHTAVELLAGIPSVVYGLVGMILLVPAIRVAFNLPSGATLLAAIIVLSIMILPSIISVSETALRAVPREYEEASLALGATHIETVFRVTVPAARSGIATAIVLGIGRAIGEAMAIIMVAGNVANMPGLLTPVRFLTTAIASEMSYASVGSLHRNALFSIGLVLFLFIMMINVFLNVFIKKKKEA